MATTLLLASRNAHKAREIADMLPPRYEVRTLADYPDLPEAEENGRTFASNAAQKAETVSAAMPDALVLADDSGLCVDALCGAPGILSARFDGEHGDDAANNRKLLRELSPLLSLAPFTARFVCAMSLAKAGRQIASFTGTVEGRITLHPRGTEGFGYDPLFVPVGHGDATFAQLPAATKNAISHRSQALAQVCDYLATTAADK